MSQHKRQEELMSQRREDRAREQYDRDLTSLMNDLRNSRGDRSQEEFAKSDDFISLVDRHKGSKVFEKALGEARGDGKTRKIRKILRDGDKNHMLVVDVFGADGKQISSGRPITDNGESREANPHDTVSKFSGEDIYGMVMGAVQQSSDYKDMVGMADRYAETAAATDPDPAGLAATTPAAPSTAPAAPSTAPATDQGTDDNFQPKTKGNETSVEGQAAAQMEAEDEAELSPWEEKQQAITGITNQIEFAENEMQETMFAFQNEMGGMSREQRTKGRAAIKDMWTGIQSLQGQLTEVEDTEVEGEPSTAYEVGSAARDAGETAVEFAGNTLESMYNAITDNPAVDAAKELWAGLSRDSMPGTTKAEEFTAGNIEKEADQAVKGSHSFEDYLKGKEGAELKDKTPAQDKKIQKVNNDAVAAYNSGTTLTRKMVMDFRKAQRAQLIHGDITPAQARANYDAMLARFKKKAGSFQMHVGKDGTVTIMNKATGQFGQEPGKGGGQSAADTRKDEVAQRKEMRQMAIDIVGKDNEFGKREILSLVDKTRNVLDLNLLQKGSFAAIDDAYKLWGNAIKNETSVWGMQWLGTTPGEAKKQNPSMTPFLAASMLEVPDAQGAVDFAKELALVNGDSKLTEGQWLAVAQRAQEAAEVGLHGEEAKAAILDYYKNNGIQ